MKRSEVVEIIVATMNNYYPINSPDITEVSEKILRSLEEVGMLPPNRAIVDGKFNQQKFNEIVNTGISCNQWEKE